MRRLFPATLLAGAAACASIPELAPGAAPGRVEISEVEAVQPPVDERPADPGHYLHLLVRSSGIDLSSGIAHLRSLRKAGGGQRKQVGHCWIALETPDLWLEVGHSGEAGKDQPAYSNGVVDAMQRRDPNPIAYLWSDMRDGFRWENEDDWTPTFACCVPITIDQAAALRRFVEEYDYGRFALRGHACSHFAVRAAHLVDLELQNIVRVEVPQRIRYMGRAYTLWSDPAYAQVEYGSPEVFEDGLRTLVASGAAEARPISRSRRR